MSTKRELDKIVREYRRLGWVVEQTRNCHWRWQPPGADSFIITSGSPGNSTAILNIKADLKRAGRQGR